MSNETHQLGNIQKSYTPRNTPGKVLLGVAIFCGIVSVLEFVTAVNKYLAPPHEILGASYRNDAILIATILGVVFLLLAAALSAMYYAHTKHRVDIYELGVVIMTWRGSTIFQWNQIDDFKVLPIYGRSRRPVNWDCTITRNDGVKTQFRGLENLEALIKTIERKIAIDDGY